ncbi:MAG: FadR family transcriptional regulator [Chloroflexi bacterium]|nr:FadR family transcriptional regulator [Chloroflexota bacterium]
MARDKLSQEHLSEFMQFLISCKQNDCDRLPALTDLSRQLGISVASLREQLEVARALGLVEVRPRTGIRRLPYTFKPAVQQSLAYAIAIDPANFQAFADIRKHIEAAYWYQSVSRLTPEDHQYLREMVQRAKEKLTGNSIQIPHWEHRELHLSIYRRINNPFVTGMLESYWDMYEAAGLDVYTDLHYLVKVWQYHEKMVDCISAGDFEAGHRALTEHMDLLVQRQKPTSHHRFE